MHDHNFIVSSGFRCMEQSHFWRMIILISFLPTTGKGNCIPAVVFLNPQNSLGDICFALSTFRRQLKLNLLPFQIMGFSVPQNSRHFMMFTWSNQLTLNTVKTVLQVHKTTHQTQRTRHRRYNVTASLIIFNNFSFKRE